MGKQSFTSVEVWFTHVQRVSTGRGDAADGDDDGGEAEGHGDHENDIVGTRGSHRLEDMLLRSLRGAHEDITGAASPVSMKSDTFGRGETLTQFFNTKQVSKPRRREKERGRKEREKGLQPPGTPVHLGGDGVKGPRTNSPRTSEARDPRGKARRRGGGRTLCGLRPWIPQPGRCPWGAGRCILLSTDAATEKSPEGRRSSPELPGGLSAGLWVPGREGRRPGPQTPGPHAVGRALGGPAAVVTSPLAGSPGARLGPRTPWEPQPAQRGAGEGWGAGASHRTATAERGAGTL